MRVFLDYKINIEVKEGDKLKEKLSVFLREHTPEEKREQKKLVKRFAEIFKEANKLGRKKERLTSKINTLQKKSDLHEMNGDYESSISVLDEKEDIDNKIDDIDARIEELDDELADLGGNDQEAFNEASAKKRFESLVSGDGKDKLTDYAEAKGYQNMMISLDKEKDALEKKLSGESQDVSEKKKGARS